MVIPWNNIRLGFLVAVKIMVMTLDLGITGQSSCMRGNIEVLLGITSLLGR